MDVVLESLIERASDIPPSSAALVEFKDQLTRLSQDDLDVLYMLARSYFAKEQPPFAEPDEEGNVSLPIDTLPPRLQNVLVLFATMHDPRGIDSL